MPTSQQHPELKAAEKHLRKADPVMDRLIHECGPCRVWNMTKDSLFHSLAWSIIGQQLSVKAAATIYERVAKATSKPLTPKSYLTATHDELRGAGLSNSKVTYIRNLAEAVDSGALSKRKLQNLDDHDVIKELTKVKGIGAWTAEMYLIFGLKRLDIVSLGDLGLQRAAENLYNNGKPKDGLLKRVSEKWKPYRSVASWYLWESSDKK